MEKVTDTPDTEMEEMETQPDLNEVNKSDITSAEAISILTDQLGFMEDEISEYFPELENFKGAVSIKTNKYYNRFSIYIQGVNENRKALFYHIHCNINKKGEVTRGQIRDILSSDTA